MTFLIYIIVVLLPNVRNVRTLRLIIRMNPIICFFPGNLYGGTGRRVRLKILSFMGIGSIPIISIFFLP